jgi:hypothetical protein
MPAFQIGHRHRRELVVVLMSSDRGRVQRILFEARFPRSIEERVKARYLVGGVRGDGEQTNGKDDRESKFHVGEAYLRRSPATMLLMDNRAKSKPTPRCMTKKNRVAFGRLICIPRTLDRRLGDAHNSEAVMRISRKILWLSKAKTYRWIPKP